MSDNKSTEEMKAAVLQSHPKAFIRFDSTRGRLVFYSAPHGKRLGAGFTESEAIADAYTKLPAPTAEAAQPLPALPKPMTLSKYWNNGVDWPLAGERAARLEREDQLRAALARTREVEADRQLALKAYEMARSRYQTAEARIAELEDQLAALRAEIERHDKWISVEEEMPELGNVVLFWKANQMNIGQYRKYQDIPDFRCFSGTYIEATHWRPLPEPPTSSPAQPEGQDRNSEVK